MIYLTLTVQISFTFLGFLAVAGPFTPAVEGDVILSDSRGDFVDAPLARPVLLDITAPLPHPAAGVGANAAPLHRLAAVGAANADPLPLSAAAGVIDGDLLPRPMAGMSGTADPLRPALQNGSTTPRHCPVRWWTTPACP